MATSRQRAKPAKKAKGKPTFAAKAKKGKAPAARPPAAKKAKKAKKPGKAARPAIPRPARTQPSGTASAVREPRIETASAPLAPRRDSSTAEDVRPSYPGRTSARMELAWEEAPAPISDELVDKWVGRGEALLTQLAAHGCEQHEYRADLKDGRFVWVDPEGLVSAEASARVLCSWSKSTHVLAMGWADPLVRSAAVPRLDGLPSERDDVTEEQAWHVAMEAAEDAGAEYVYRVPAHHAWYFLALDGLTFAPASHAFSPGNPVGLVLRTLGDARTAVESRAEPAAIVRERLHGVGSALLHEASFAYRNTDWVSRLERTGRCLVTLASRLPRPSFRSLAAGNNAEEFLTREVTLDLSQAISLLEDEWSLFA